MTKNKQTFSIRETAETLVPDSLGRSSYLLALLLIVLMLMMITALLTKLPPSIPLYFTLPWGETRLAPKFMLYILPGASFLFLCINLGLGRISMKLSPFLPRILAVSTTVIVSMMVISLLGIVQSLIL
jgi:hypothetical protein